MKIALCFIISYEHILNKEDIWREWIEPNKDIINVYFYYKDITKIKSKWILEHAISPKYIYETSYYHVIPAYTSILSFAVNHDKNNQWFCLLTDSCFPIISPKRFKYLFYENYNKTIMAWKKASWNVNFHKKANLALLPEEFRLRNEPWFVIKREHVLCINNYMNTKKEIVKTICSGGLANESLFAIIFYACKQLHNSQLISSPTHAADWSRMTTATSPHIFKNANETDIIFIEKFLKENKTKQGYLKDGFVVDSDADDEDEYETEDEDSDDLDNTDDSDEKDDLEGEMIEDLGSELSEDIYDYSSDEKK